MTPPIPRRRFAASALRLLPAALLLALPGCDSNEAQSSDPPLPDSVDFAAHVAPVLYANCASCHYPEGIAPFSVLDYEDVREWGPDIVAATEERFMPPWLPAAGKGEFVGERRLSDIEIGTLRRWVEQGMQQGDPGRLPTRPEPSRGWDLGTPDLVVTLPEAFPVPADGRDIYRNLVIPVPGGGTRWVRAVEIRPDHSGVVHHATLMVDATGQARRLDATDPAPGFEGMMHHGSIAPPDGFFIGWTPGKRADPGDESLAWKLEEGMDLVLQLHLRPLGQETVVQPSVGLHFAAEPPKEMPLVVTLGSLSLDIPAGESEYQVEDDYRLPVDVEALRVYPHAHYLGKEMQAWAELPDGTTKWLLHIPEWDFDWQDEYRYAQPVDLPRGTHVRMRFTYDNSAANPRNPHSPPQRVRYGPESTDEMSDLILQLLPRDPADRVVLQQDFDRKVHSDFTSMAVQDYRDALRVSPDDARVHTRLGAALLEEGELAEALLHLRRAVELDTGSAEAHYFLALALRSEGRLDESIGHFRLALDSDPDFAEAHLNLGAVLVSRGRSEEAASHYRRAAELLPDSVDPLIALGWLLATHPDPEIRQPEEAVEIASRAVALSNETHPLALDALAAAYAAAGDFTRAQEAAERAAAIAEAGGAPELANGIRARKSLYERGEPFVQPSR